MPVNVLVVDDNAADVVLLETAAARMELGYMVTSARDGEQALAILERVGKREIDRPDLIVLDLNLPRVGGARILEEIRRHPYLDTIPVVVLSGAELEQDGALPTLCAPGSYFVKPGTFAEFKTLVIRIDQYRQQCQ